MTHRESGVVHTLGRRHVVPSSPEGEVVPFYLEDRKLRISVTQVDGQAYAFDDLCPCASPPCPLSGGLLDGTTLTCQCHGSEFDITTGAVVRGPAAKPLHLYPVQQLNGDCVLHLDKADGVGSPGIPHGGSSWPLVGATVTVTVLALPIVYMIRRNRRGTVGLS